jgi:hypothetical protein
MAGVELPEFLGRMKSDEESYKASNDVAKIENQNDKGKKSGR